MPRSGTSWLAQIFASHPDTRLKLCPLFSHAFRGTVDRNSSKAEWEHFFDAVHSTSDEYMDQDFLRRDGLVPEFADAVAPSPRLVIKSNRFHDLLPRMLDLGLDLGVLLIVRDPRATIASWLNNPREFPVDADPGAEWRSGACRKTGPGEFWGFDDWCTVTSMYLDLADRHPEMTYLLRYEDLLRDPSAKVEDLFGWAQLDVHARTSAFVADSASRHDDNPRSVFKNHQHLAERELMLDQSIQDTILEEVGGTALGQFLDADLAQRSI